MGILRYWSNLLVDLVQVLWPIGDTEVHHPAMYIVEGLRELPLLVNVINMEPNIGGNAS